VRGTRLTEFTAEIAVSAQHAVAQPVTVCPALSVAAGAPAGLTRIVINARQLLAGETAVTRVFVRPAKAAQIGGQPPAQTGATVSFDLPVGRHLLLFTVARDLVMRFYGMQRNQQDLLTATGLRVATNRVFDEHGNETQPASSALSTRLFGDGPISPLDTWTLELPVDQNPFLQAVTGDDDLELDLGDMNVLLTLEYEAVANPAPQLQAYASLKQGAAWVSADALPVGVPVTLRIDARDTHTRDAVPGKVSVGGAQIATTGAEFAYTLGADGTTAIVASPGYPDADVTLRPCGLQIVDVEPASVPVGNDTQLTVKVRDARTGVAVSGRVWIDGVDRGPTGDAPFHYTFSGSESVTVHAAGYPVLAVDLAFHLPQLQVWVEPPRFPVGQPVTTTIHARDSRTGALVAGRILIDGSDRGATGVALTATFKGSEHLTVRAPGYPDAAVEPVFCDWYFSVWAEPSSVEIATPVQVTVRLRDILTGAVPAGAQVLINGAVAGPIETAFSRTFQGNEQLTVRVSGYPDTVVPFTIFKRLVTQAAPSSVVIGTQVQISVTARDAHTNAACAGQVLIGTSVVAATGAPFNYTFWGREHMSVAVPGYPNADVSLTFNAPYTGGVTTKAVGAELL
jgi:hypothetical protein